VGSSMGQVIQTHPASRIEELLPHRWKPPDPTNIDCA